MGWRRDKAIPNNNSWSIDAWRSLDGGKVGDAESQSRIVGRVRNRSGNETVDEMHSSREREQKNTFNFDSVASHMAQKLGASESCKDKVKWLWMRQRIDKIELWTLTNLMGINLVAGMEFLVQQPKVKITGTLIPDRDVDCEKRNCQRGFESLETIDGGIHEGNQSSIVEGLRAMGSCSLIR